PRLSPWFPWVALHTTLDDDVTPGAIRFLLALDERTGDARYRRAAERGVDLRVRAQLDSGAWPPAWRPPWLRALHGPLRDRPRLPRDRRDPALGCEHPPASGAGARGAPRGEWLLAAQQSPPRAGWAQQYDEAGRPAGMRPFEPAALASWESRHAIDALDAL